MTSAPQAIQDWFTSPAIELNDCEGYQATNRGVRIGFRVINDWDITNAIHDMAHLVEIDDARCCRWNFGLVYPEFEIPTSTLCTERELRVFAIQYVITEHLGIEQDVTESAKNLQWFPDWWLFDAQVGIASSIEVISSAILSTAEGMNIDEIWSEWCRKVEIIESQVDPNAEEEVWS